MDYEVIRLSEAGPELASAPFQTHARLTQIAMAEKPMGFIADDVLPRVDSPYAFRYTKGLNADQFTIPDTRASRAGRLNEVEFGAELADGSTEDHGLLAFVPYRDIDEARRQQSAWDPQAQAAMGTSQLIELDRERRAANLVFNAASYPAGYKTALAGNGQWSDPASDPLKVILAALDIPITRPNVLVFGQATWTQLRTHPRIVESIVKAGAGGGAAGVVTREAVAALFEVERVLVGAAWHQTAKRGQDPVYARLWGKHAAALHVRRPAGTRDMMPTWGFTAQAMARQVAMSEEPERGVGRGSRVVKVSECIRELVSWSTAGYFWQNAVA